MRVSHEDVRVTEDGHPDMVLTGRVEPNGHVSLRAEQGPITITYLDGDIAGGRFTGQMDTSLVTVGTCQFGVDLTRE
jgi:hypothetical protein